jgi:hypothetical protein
MTVIQYWTTRSGNIIVFGTGFGGINSMNIGPDGLLYVVSVEHGKVYKIMPHDKYTLNKVDTKLTGNAENYDS